MTWPLEKLAFTSGLSPHPSGHAGAQDRYFFWVFPGMNRPYYDGPSNFHFEKESRARSAVRESAVFQAQRNAPNGNVFHARLRPEPAKRVAR